ncbi:hypothetical protein O166_05000 [Pseudogulbenkiania ferrooxidans EGD-HP2]|uniref:Uncharacterized protein n=1 Tax=Pseudogulbenkiania ferrooxidans EGD-HP2 TaxID=1388764 RepID=A0ABP2XPT5_9NEIS|nr:hypothetical protein O166_05000 [Pseudogulbenkiania ferrooxidans EGD-HP2]
MAKELFVHLSFDCLLFRLDMAIQNSHSPKLCTKCLISRQDFSTRLMSHPFQRPSVFADSHQGHQGINRYSTINLTWGAPQIQVGFIDRAGELLAHRIRYPFAGKATSEGVIKCGNQHLTNPGVVQILALGCDYSLGGFNREYIKAER